MALDLSDLLAPFSPETFFAEYWGRRPLHIARNQKEVFASLFSSHAVEQLLLVGAAVAGRVHFITGDGGYQPTQGLFRADGTIDPVKAMARFSQGATIVVNGLRMVWPALSNMCWRIESTLGHPVEVNSYLTPRAAQGFPVHADPHDVLVLQIEGTKHWRLYQRSIADPLVAQLSAAGRPTECLAEVELKPGDVLYVPSGFPHEALTTARQSSLHLTVGIHRFRWLDLAIQALKDAAASESWLREAIPPGPLAEQIPTHAINEATTRLNEILPALNFSSARVELAREFLARARPVASPAAPSWFSQIDRALGMRMGSLLANRFPGLVTVEETRSGGGVIMFPGGQASLGPLEIPSAREVALARTFKPSSLNSNLDDHSLVALLARLVTSGLLIVEADGP